ncbi:hypothetical protein [Paenibacillus sp. NFR01]|uniref:hypothetical protein n=1 Tax=Paenibacillus sp. NFR01 TaxID=1566279 RepID=UPI0008D8C5E0|nr:hypothetical protein [Paenibacillus sp. NFR01]SET94225.1 hypothetical protein SAMN03159358_2788 [Paenibacillus sp. NFR01]
MKILISQPNHEGNLEQLQTELALDDDFDTVLFPEGYIRDKDNVARACALANKYKKMIITGYRDNNKDRALIINQHGEIILERAKTPMNVRLYTPSAVEVNGFKIGYLLCVELLQGLLGLEEYDTSLTYIAHPIGVGMFSRDQLDEWISEAKRIAVRYNTMILGTSHADGSYRNCGISIPISYCIDRTGDSIFISENDLRTRIINLETKKYEIIERTLA